jgi:hypothetical protein
MSNAIESLLAAQKNAMIIRPEVGALNLVGKLFQAQIRLYRVVIFRAAKAPDLFEKFLPHRTGKSGSTDLIYRLDKRSSKKSSIRNSTSRRPIGSQCQLAPSSRAKCTISRSPVSCAYTSFD